MTIDDTSNLLVIILSSNQLSLSSIGKFKLLREVPQLESLIGQIVRLRLLLNTLLSEQEKL